MAVDRVTAIKNEVAIYNIYYLYAINLILEYYSNLYNV